MEKGNEHTTDNGLSSKQGEREKRVGGEVFLVYHEANDEHATEYQLSNRMSVGPSRSPRVGSGDSDEEQTETDNKEYQSDKVELPEQSLGASPQSSGERGSGVSSLSSRFDLGSSDSIGLHVDVQGDDDRGSKNRDEDDEDTFIRQYPHVGSADADSPKPHLHWLEPRSRKLFVKSPMMNPLMHCRIEGAIVHHPGY